MVDVGINVIIRISEVDKGKLNDPNLISVMLEKNRARSIQNQN